MVRTAADYVVPNASVNEPSTYAHVGLMPGSINEPTYPLPTAPKLTSLVPATAAAGGTVTVHLMGTGFGDYTMMAINGTNKVPAFVSATELTTSLRLAKGTYALQVKNGPYSSNTLNFTFT